MKILWHSNAPFAATGYANQTNVFGPRFSAAGHQVLVSAFYGLQGGALNWGDIRLLPKGHADFGNDIIEAHALAHKVDVVATLMDVWVLPRETMAKLPWLAWTPLDHAPMQAGIFEMLKVCRWPVAMSRFGLGQMEAKGLQAFYVPHGVETSPENANAFHPVDRVEARKTLAQLAAAQHGQEDLITDETFLVAVVAANKGFPSRKAYPEMLQAWKELTRRYDNVHLYLHTERFGVNGVPLDDVIALLEIPPETVTFAPQYTYATGAIGPQALNGIYNAADVLLNPSYGEGFGIPIIEAQAAGCPVIVGDNTAQVELCHAGWRVEGTPIITPQMSFQWMPKVEQIVAALEAAREARGDASLRQSAREFGLQYDADRVMAEYWTPVWQAVEADLQAARKAASLVQKFSGNGTLEDKRAKRREKYQAEREGTPA